MYATQPDWWLPRRMIVMNTDTGKMIAQFPAVGGSDEMFLIPQASVSTFKVMKASRTYGKK
jgi:hypothetical protein